MVVSWWRCLDYLCFGIMITLYKVLVLTIFKYNINMHLICMWSKIYLREKRNKYDFHYWTGKLTNTKWNCFRRAESWKHDNVVVLAYSNGHAIGFTGNFLFCLIFKFLNSKLVLIFVRDEQVFLLKEYSECNIIGQLC